MYTSSLSWSPRRPHVLVVACSDGRFEGPLDDFLVNHLGISGYDRLYVPGGPGALASSDVESGRVEQHRKECQFLLEAHGVEELILLFHSGGPDGPEEAMCADYRRKHPDRTTAQLREQQETDAAELVRSVFFWPPELRIRVFRAETMPDHTVRFVDLGHSR